METDLTTVSGLDDNRNGILALPRAFYTVGADIEIGNFRIGGGMLYKGDDPHYAIRLGDGATIDIGEGTYTAPEVTQLTTTLFSDAWAPYALVGFGQHTSSGLGLFLDVGVAFLDHPELSMSATGDGSVLRSRGFRDDLHAEQQSGAQRHGRSRQLLADPQPRNPVRDRGRRPETPCQTLKPAPPRRPAPLL